MRKKNLQDFKKLEKMKMHNPPARQQFPFFSIPGRIITRRETI